MPNNILITPGSASIQFSGSAANTIRLQVEQSGSIAFYGASGSLFGITDQLSGSLMSVNDISGLPILEVFSDDRVVMGSFNRNTLVVTGSRIGVDKAVPQADLDITGSVFITGSLTVTGSVVIASGGLGVGNFNYGTAGQVLVSNGSLTTPTWNSQGYELVSTASADGTPTSIDFTLDATRYKFYKLIFSELGAPAYGGTIGDVRITFLDTASGAFSTVYTIQTIQSGSTGIANGSSTFGSILLTTGTLTSTTRLTGELVIGMHPNSTNYSRTTGVNSSGRVVNWFSFNQIINGASPVGLLRLQFAGGAFQGITGSLYLLGRRI